MHVTRSKGLVQLHQNPRINEFLIRPSNILLDSFVKEELVLLADYWDKASEAAGRKISDLRTYLFALSVEYGLFKPTKMTAELSELELRLKIAELESARLEKIEMAKIALQEKELALAEEKLKLETDKFKSEESYREQRLSMVVEGRLDASLLSEPVALQGSGPSSLAHNIRLLPKFSEKDPDTFFILFERIADSRKWPEEEQVIVTVRVGRESPRSVCCAKPCASPVL